MRGEKKKLCVFEDWGFHRREQEMVESAPLLGLSQSAQVFLLIFGPLKKKILSVIKHVNKHVQSTNIS